MTCEVGARVGAIRSATKAEVHLYGYGVYLGPKIPESADTPLLGDFKHFNIKNPCIKLDSGDIVWGCECWWGSEEAVKKSIGLRKVIIVDIKEDRK